MLGLLLALEYVWSPPSCFSWHGVLEIFAPWVSDEPWKKAQPFCPHFRPHRGGFGELFRTHLFVTAGNLLGNFDFHRNRDFSRSMDEAINNFRLSYGIGLALKLGGIARVELNYCIPIRAQRGDRPAPGLQLGVGVSFLWSSKNIRTLKVLVSLSLLVKLFRHFDRVGEHKPVVHGLAVASVGGLFCRFSSGDFILSLIPETIFIRQWIESATYWKSLFEIKSIISQ